MHIAILAPTHRSFISKFLPEYKEDDLPEGYNGAPWIGPIIQELINEGHKLTIITTSKSHDGIYFTHTFNSEYLSWIVIPFRPHSFRFNGNKLGRIIDFYDFEQKEIIKNLKVLNPEFVHAFWSYEFAGAAIKSNIPCLITVEDNAYKIFGYFKNMYRFFRLLMSEKYLLNNRYASVPSPYMFKYVKKRCETVKIIPNPVSICFDESQIKSLVDSKFKSFSCPKIIMIFNGWDERKNGKSALKAFKLLLNRIPQAQLFLYGHGTERNGDAFNDAKHLNLENVIFNGAISHNNIIDAIRDSHILLHSALEESFGVVLIESMSLGVPAIGGRNSGAAPWVIKNENLHVDVRNPEEMANKMFDLLTDEEFYRRSSISGFLNVLERFSSKNVVKSYLEYYEEILQKN